MYCYKKSSRVENLTEIEETTMSCGLCANVKTTLMLACRHVVCLKCYLKHKICKECTKKRQCIIC